MSNSGKYSRTVSPLDIKTYRFSKVHVNIYVKNCLVLIFMFVLSFKKSMHFVQERLQFSRGLVACFGPFKIA